jgi:glutathione transport system substrate-binding protein
MTMHVISRTRRLGLAAGLAAALGVLAASPAFAAKDVVIAVPNTLTTLDPHDANDTLSQALNKSYYQGLYGFDKDMKLQPVLADGNTVSPDGLSYTFALKKGIKFHDGTDFKADSVKATFDRVTNPDNKHRRYSLYSNIESTTVLTEYLVKITLKKPFSAFVNVMAHPSSGIISAAAIQKYGKDLAFNPVGTGPFRFVEWTKTDYLKVEKNPAYWQPGLPKVDTITFKPVPDNNTRTAVIQTGEAHMVTGVAYEQVDLIKGKPGITTVVAPSIYARYIAMNLNKKPFTDLRVRQAINYAINKQALAKVAYNGNAAPLESVVPPGVEYSHKTGPWPYDPAKARQLLKEAGYPNGFDTELWSLYNHTTALKVIQFLQQQLAQVGIKAKLTALESGQRVERIESVQRPEDAGSQMVYGGWSASTGEADWALRPLLGSAAWPPRGFNLGYYKSEDFDSAVAGALSSTDRKEKAAFYKKAQELVWKDAPWAFLLTEKLVYAHSKKLSGAYVMPDGSLHLDNIDLK